ncbi:cob(I)yrinic acid a,c-diamide adenosyltransferase [Selenomonas sp. TAMA-11512]|uniref:cob(I)yrinic acid a,c-diamide adenosyltransferase n=1 Tax=Selenomonas sp. TAMA-11512 TaxID=3095337 RepID=UPI0030915B4F|nr:cob(I)yrinic acid a,c-diamide adenosyltransferase [Selenomonas sp. TAMA-11512]
MIQVYTGDGKGKTTAAVGLAVRAAGAGKSVYIVQFMKGRAYSEQRILAGLPHLRLDVTGKPFFVAKEGMLTEEERAAWGDDVVVFAEGHPPEDYVRELEAGVERAIRAVSEHACDVLILDEINVALHFGLVRRELIELLLARVAEASANGHETEVVCTGRKTPDWLLERADLITEMREVRHYYQKGIEARIGIEC